MNVTPMTVLVIGATGSVGRLVVEEALARGDHVRVLTRDAARARRLPEGCEIIQADVTRPGGLAAAVDGVDAIVFTHGSNGGRAETEQVDYGALRNVLVALGARRARVALMTSIGVTERLGSYNRRTLAHDWKRRSERLLRASGLPYTIVRPGWFDYNTPDQMLPLLLQGDRRHAGDPSDGVIARRQIAQILVASLTSEAARDKTFELVAGTGQAPDDLDLLFAPLERDVQGSLDGVRDLDNMPLDQEPASVLLDLESERSRGQVRQSVPVARGHV